MSGVGKDLPDQEQNKKKTPKDFLGENAALVNLDNLVSKTSPSLPKGNSFGYLWKKDLKRFTFNKVLFSYIWLICLFIFLILMKKIISFDFWK